MMKNNFLKLKKINFFFSFLANAFMREKIFLEFWYSKERLVTISAIMSLIFNHSFYKKYLSVTALVIGVGGPLFTLAAAGYRRPAEIGMDILAARWNSQSFEHPTTRFLSALSGGFLVGWGVFVYKMSDRVYDADPEGVRQVLLSGLCSWFLFDSFGSIASGHPANALWNVAVLLLAVGPFWWSLPPAQKKK